MRFCKTEMSCLLIEVRTGGYITIYMLNWELYVTARESFNVILELGRIYNIFVFKRRTVGISRTFKVQRNLFPVKVADTQYMDSRVHQLLPSAPQVIPSTILPCLA